MVPDVIGTAAVGPVLGRRTSGGSNEAVVVVVRDRVHVDVVLSKPDWPRFGSRQVRARWYLSHKFSVDRVTVLTWSRHGWGGRRSTGERIVRRAADRFEACAGVGSGLRERGIECCLVDRAGLDILTAGFPLGHHSVADAEMIGELTNAHSSGFSKRPSLTSRPASDVCCGGVFGHHRRKSNGQLRRAAWCYKGSAGKSLYCLSRVSSSEVDVASSRSSMALIARTPEAAFVANTE